MNVNEFIVHAYPIQNEEFLLRVSHLTNYLDWYVASAKQNRLANIKLTTLFTMKFFLIFDIFITLRLPPVTQM